VRLLLDSHALFWWLGQQSLLSKRAFEAIAGERNEVFVSIVSAWEMAIKVGTGKWPKARDLVEGFEEEINKAGFKVLPITIPHVRLAGLLHSPHRDPFDRLLAAQAAIEGLTLVSSDAKMLGLGADVIW
jgi:PIN domain nuclease of toxin-antitoxin system